MNTAFVSTTAVSVRAAPALSNSSFTASRPSLVTAPVSRRSAVVTMKGPELPKIPQGFTAFSEELNGRAAMLGFMLAIVTEAITGKGIIGQVASIFDVVNLASALGN